MKKKNKKIKKVKKSMTFIQKYNYLLKNMYIKLLANTFNRFFGNKELSNIIEYFDYIKDVYYDLSEMAEVADYNTNPQYITVIDYIQDMYISLLNYSELFETKDVLMKTKDSIIEFLKDETSMLNTILSSCKISGIVLGSCEEIIPKNITNYDSTLMRRIISFTNFMIQFSSFYIIKYKNLYIKKLDIHMNKISIVYDSKLLVDEKTIDSLIKLIAKPILSDSEKLYYRKTTDIIDALAQPFTDFTNNADIYEFISSSQQVYIDNNLDNIPFKNTDKFQLTDDTLLDIVDNRKYIIPKCGVCIDILDKNYDIDRIEVKEDTYNIHMCLYLNNNGNLFNLEHTQSFNDNLQAIIDKQLRNGLINNRPIESKTVKLYISINKYLLNKQLFEAAYNFPIIDASNKALALDNLYITCYSCLYLLYCNPYIYKKVTRLYNLKKEHAKGYTKEAFYRVGFLRKLPKGYKMSTEARNNALQEGFINVPRGYTFVRASNLELADKSEMRVIKI